MNTQKNHSKESDKHPIVNAASHNEDAVQFVDLTAEQKINLLYKKKKLINKKSCLGMKTQFLKRFIPDYRFKLFEVTKIIRFIMQNGELSKAEKIFYKFSDKFIRYLRNHKTLNDESLDDRKLFAKMFLRTIGIVKKNMDIIRIKIGGVFYRCPVSTTKFRVVTKALKCFVKNSRKLVVKNGISMDEALFREFINTNNKMSLSYKQHIEFMKNVKNNLSYSYIFFKIQKRRKNFNVTDSYDDFSV